MFKNLFDLSFKRTVVQAIGFYIVYIILIALLIGVLSPVIGPIIYPNTQKTFEESFQIGAKMAPIIATTLVTIVSVWIIIAKKSYKHFGAIVLLIVAICLTHLLGALVGIIPVAILTTFDNNNNS